MSTAALTICTYAPYVVMSIFTGAIPIGLAVGGFLIDHVCEPFMDAHKTGGLLTVLFGIGKGSGAAAREWRRMTLLAYRYRTDPGSIKRIKNPRKVFTGIFSRLLTDPLEELEQAIIETEN